MNEKAKCKNCTEEMIEEITQVINVRCEAELGQVHASSMNGKVTKTVDTSLIAKDIYNAGYRKIPKGSVVVDKEYQFDCSRCKDRKCTKDGFCCDETFCKTYNRLAELEDDLESGKMIRLPCKEGDTVWFIRATDREIIKAVVTRIVFNTELSFEVADKYCDYIVFAKGIFLTKADAEKKLKELKGEV